MNESLNRLLPPPVEEPEARTRYFESAKAALAVGLNVFVILAVTGMVVMNPSLVNYLLGAGVLASTYVLGRVS